MRHCFNIELLDRRHYFQVALPAGWYNDGATGVVALQDFWLGPGIEGEKKKMGRVQRRQNNGAKLDFKERRVLGIGFRRGAEEEDGGTVLWKKTAERCGGRGRHGGVLGGGLRSENVRDAGERKRGSRGQRISRLLIKRRYLASPCCGLFGESCDCKDW